MVLSSEIGTAVEISSIQWHKHAEFTSTDAEDEDFKLYLGLCGSDQLNTGSFDGNYISGTKTLVYSSDLLIVDMDDEWAEIVLDDPYWYNGTGNLIIEIEWANETHDNSYYNHEWYAGDNRCVFSQGSPDIVAYGFLPHMILAGTLALENSTFASIKVELGQ
ncbi:MAG: hypothetical protein KAH31_02405 [Candidatus Sabulitectum sp.]|nr:hypothetical protein [Candidatus Sabulitectum sp.]